MIGAYDPIIAAAARRFNVPEERIRAVMGVESSGNSRAVSPKGAAGLMQVMPDTYREVAQANNLGPDRFDPTNNIMAGTAYMRQMYDQFGNWDEAHAAYNMGPGRAMQVRNGTATVPAETAAYGPKVKAALATYRPSSAWSEGQGNQPGGADVPLFSSNRAPTDEDAARWSNSAFGGLLGVGPENNFYDGLGNLLNFGQTQSDPPRTDPAAMPGTTQTDRMDLSGRINELIGQYVKQPPVQMPSQLQYMLAGAQKGMQGLAGVHDRKVGIGEMLGALGGGVTSGAFAGNEAQQQQRSNQIGELGTLAKLQGYQRTEATAAAKVQAARQYAAQLRQSGDPQKVQLAAAIENDPSLMDNVIPKQAEAAFPKIEPYTLAPGAQRRDAAGNIIASNPTAQHNPATPPTPVTLGDGPQGPGIYARNPDGTVGPRLGASETAPAGETAPTITQEQAQQAGLPAPPANSPYSNPNLSPRGRSNLVSAQQKSWEKRATDNAEAVQTANGLITDMQRFQYLNSQTDTGGVTGLPIGGAVRSLWDANIKEMNSIRDRITPTLRQPGSGATSDFDARMFQGGTVGVDKPKQVNDNIATATIEGGKNLIAKAQFEQQYFDAYQHTGGMEAAWQRYLNANPIFDPKAKPGSYELNRNRVDWQTYFRNGEKAPEPSDRARPADSRPQAPMSGGEGSGGSSVLRFDEKGNPIQ